MRHSECQPTRRYRGVSGSATLGVSTGSAWSKGGTRKTLVAFSLGLSATEPSAVTVFALSFGRGKMGSLDCGVQYPHVLAQNSRIIFSKNTEWHRSIHRPHNDVLSTQSKLSQASEGPSLRHSPLLCTAAGSDDTTLAGLAIASGGASRLNDRKGVATADTGLAALYTCNY